MRKSICIGMILRSDDNVASGGTLGTMLRIGQAVEKLGIELEFLPCMGAGKDLARNEVLGAYKAKSKADDLLFIDFGNALPGFNPEIAALTLKALLACEYPAVWCPYGTRAANRFSYACSLPGNFSPRTYVRIEPTDLGDIRLMQLGGCGFGWTRLRRDFVDLVWSKYEGTPGTEEEPIKNRHGFRGRSFISDRVDLTGEEIACVDLFSSRLGPRPGEDKERPHDMPYRSNPEDDSFWQRAYIATGKRPAALVDFPIAHGKSLQPGINCPTFAEYYQLDAEEIVSDARLHDSIPPAVNGA